jgi:hypothetical protein
MKDVAFLDLLHYIVAACHRKINLRLKHNLSKRYLESLTSIDSLAIESNGFRGSVLTEPVSDTQTKSDKEFFTKILPYYFPLTPTNLAIIQRAESGQQIYSAETYLGFHILLLPTHPISGRDRSLLHIYHASSCLSNNTSSFVSPTGMSALSGRSGDSSDKKKSRSLLFNPLHHTVLEPPVRPFTFPLAFDS